MGLFDKLGQGLSKTRNGFVKQMKSMLSGFSSVDDDLIDELEEILILADVGVGTAQTICTKLRARVKENALKDPGQVIDEVRAIVTDIMMDQQPMRLNGSPAVILVIGVNGVGKTTSIGKLAAQLTSEGKKGHFGGSGHLPCGGN